MKSRYVLTRKPCEPEDIASAQAEGILLDDETDGPHKAKARHVMQGYSENGSEEIADPLQHGLGDRKPGFHSGLPFWRPHRKRGLLRTTQRRSTRCSTTSVATTSEDLLRIDGWPLRVVQARDQGP